MIETTNGKFRDIILASPEKGWIMTVAFLLGAEMWAATFTVSPFVAAALEALASAVGPPGDTGARDTVRVV